MRALCCVALMATLLVGCSDRSVAPTVEQGPGDDVGYDPNKDVVLVGGSTWVITGDAQPGECVYVDETCVKIDDVKRQFCGDANAQADIVIVDGKVVDVICYPPKESGVAIDTVTEVKDGQTVLPQNENHTVITFGDETNGKPVKGDVRLDAEQVALIGNGIDKTIIDGNLTIASNNAKVRGLTVTGNVVFESNANGATIAFVKVKGNLEIDSNDVTVLGCIVFGNLTCSGNNASLLSNGVGGALSVTGTVTACQDNYAFADANGNFLVDPVEKGAPLTCKAK